MFNFGNDVIEDFSAEDIIRLTGAARNADLNDVLANAREVGNGDDVLLDFGGGNTLRLEDMRLSDISVDDFNF